MKTRTTIIALLTFLSFQVLAQNPLIGTWEYKNDTARLVKIITPTHWMVFSETPNRIGNGFDWAHGGTYTLDGNKYVEKIETASWEDFENVKTDFTYEVDGDLFYQKGTLTSSDGDIMEIDEVWRKLNTRNKYDNHPGVGTWDQLSSSYTLPDGSKASHTNTTATRFQIITPTHWVRMSHREGQFENFMGGTYTLDGDRIYPNIEFSSNPDMKDTKVVIEQKISGDKMYWKGSATNTKEKQNMTFEDVFQKVNPKIAKTQKAKNKS